MAEFTPPGPGHVAASPLGHVPCRGCNTVPLTLTEAGSGSGVAQSRPRWQPRCPAPSPTRGLRYGPLQSCMPLPASAVAPSGHSCLRRRVKFDREPELGAKAGSSFASALRVTGRLKCAMLLATRGPPGPPATRRIAPLQPAPASTTVTVAASLSPYLSLSGPAGSESDSESGRLRVPADGVGH